MPQCAKCGKKAWILWVSWDDKESFPEFYEKPLCTSCYSELDNARKESSGETAIDALCDHLRLMGLNATVESKLHPYPHWGIIGSVRVANRNIDLVEMDWARKAVGEYGDSSVDVYRCNFVVQAKVDGLEDKLRAYTEPATKGFLSRAVNLEWKGKELAQVLNSDADLKKTLDLLIVNYRGRREDLPSVEVEPDGKYQCVRISPRFSYSPEAAFPTLEVFEAIDRIAHYIRSITNAGHE